jgi:hypothetical protein
MRLNHFLQQPFKILTVVRVIGLYGYLLMLSRLSNLFLAFVCGHDSNIIFCLQSYFKKHSVLNTGDNLHTHLWSVYKQQIMFNTAKYRLSPNGLYLSGMPSETPTPKKKSNLLRRLLFWLK